MTVFVYLCFLLIMQEVFADENVLENVSEGRREGCCERDRDKKTPKAALTAKLPFWIVNQNAFQLSLNDVYVSFAVLAITPHGSVHLWVTHLLKYTNTCTHTLTHAHTHTHSNENRIYLPASIEDLALFSLTLKCHHPFQLTAVFVPTHLAYWAHSVSYQCSTLFKMHVLQQSVNVLLSLLLALVKEKQCVSN